MKITLSDIINKIETTLPLDEKVLEEQSESSVPAAVLIPLFEKNSEPHILFTKRTDKVRHHKGQISFPGGVAEEDDGSLEVTALRETWEEVGINIEDVTVLGNISGMLTITNFYVTPYIGTFPYPYNFVTSEDEIHELIEVPVSHLLKKANLRIENRDINGVTYPIYYFDYNNYTIWGVTGKILYDFLNLLHEFQEKYFNNFS